jgi:hypothetical protein
MSDKLTTAGVQELYAMLKTCRPHGSRAEVDFNKKFLLPLGVTFDSFGNSWKKIGTAPIAYSSHVDTVHSLGGTQNIVRTDDYVLKLHNNSPSNCLGADDTAGVWLMAEMIRAKRPGLYIFHRGEECGGKGSDFISKHTKHLVEGMEFMVAFDRKGCDSIITHQFGGRCCSDDFGKSLAKQLGEDYKLDKGGSFTDSANYTDLIAECTNVSVGYERQHTKSEELSMHHLVDLRMALMHLDVDKLVIKRKPGEKVYDRYNYGYGGYQDPEFGWFSGGYWDYEQKKWVSCTKDVWLARKRQEKYGKKGTNVVAMSSQQEGPPVIDPTNPDEREMAAFCCANYEKIAIMLLDWGFDADSVRMCMASSLVDAGKAKATAKDKGDKTDMTSENYDPKADTEKRPM